jgi:hypothetical protein
MFLAESLFVDLDRPPMERLSLGILASVLKQKGEIVVLARNLGMFLAECLFSNLNRPRRSGSASVYLPWASSNPARLL